MKKFRTISPSITSSETFQQLEDWERFFAVTLFALVDDYGAYPLKPFQIQCELGFIGRERSVDEIENALDRLASLELIDIYDVVGNEYFKFRNWNLYQRINRPYPPQYPGFDENSQRIVPLEEMVDQHNKRHLKKSRANEPSSTLPEDDFAFFNKNYKFKTRRWINNEGLPWIASVEGVDHKTLRNWSRKMIANLAHFTEGKPDIDVEVMFSEFVNDAVRKRVSNPKSYISECVRNSEAMIA